MNKDIKVQLVFHDQSKGRGVGVYGSNLLESLKKIKGVKIVDSNPDIIHYTFFDLFYPTLKINPHVPNIVTVHDVTPLVLAEKYPKGVRSTIGLFRQWHQLKKAAAIITDSECSRKDISKILRIDESKVFVTLLAANSLYRKKVGDDAKNKIINKYNLPDKFILTVAGGPNPNKNLPNLAEVTERMNIPLVIVGGGINQKLIKPVAPELIDLVRLEVYQHIIRLDSVPNEELLVIYNLATAYVQASLYEGFGIPLLEAMVAECPIISSKTSSLPEIYHPDTITFSPKSLKSMEKAISKFLKLTSPQKKLYIQNNKERSGFFSWSKTASETVALYRKIYENNISS